MSEDKFYILAADYNNETMMLGGLPELPNDDDDDWMFGQPFTKEPDQPIEVEIREGEEDCNLLPYFQVPPIATDEFVKALEEAGVDNIMTYEVVLKSRATGEILVRGYKAINVIGMVKAAGSGTVYLGDSRLLDASIEKLDIEPRSIKGLYMFRLAESMRTIVIHEKVKRHLEAKGFKGLRFTETSDAFIL